MKRVISLKIYLKWRSSCLLAEIRKHHHRELIVFIIFSESAVIDNIMEFDFQMERSGFRPAINALGDMPVCVVARDGTIQSFNRAIWETTALLLAPGLVTNARFHCFYL